MKCRGEGERSGCFSIDEASESDDATSGRGERGRGKKKPTAASSLHKDFSGSRRKRSGENAGVNQRFPETRNEW